jgi:hypothetical protein
MKVELFLDVDDTDGFPSKNVEFESTGKYVLTSFHEAGFDGHPIGSLLRSERLLFDWHFENYCSIKNGLVEHVFHGPKGW